MNHVTVASKNIGPIRFQAVPTRDDWTLPERSPISLTDTNGRTFGDLSVGSENSVLLADPDRT